MLSDRDRLYNAMLKTVKEHAQGYERGLVLAVLSELGGAISGYSCREPIDVLFDKLQERPHRRIERQPDK